MKKLLTSLFLLGLVFPHIGCGADAPNSSMQINIFGWGEDFDGTIGFVSGLPGYPDAQTVRISVVQPFDRRVVERQTFAVSERRGTLTDISFGENLRLDVEVLDGFGTVIAGGSSPIFNYGPEDEQLSFRVQISAADSFAPVGSIVRDPATGERRYAGTNFDYRAAGVEWAGRIGHATALTSDGRLLVVGGADPVPGTAPTSLGEFRNIFADVQVFDPRTGYFTDLRLDGDQAEADQLSSRRVFHTLTPIGRDRFLVAGGFSPQSGGPRPVSSLEIIDLNEPPGQRVRPMTSLDANPATLIRARGWHTATYRSLDGRVIIAGGRGSQGETNILNEIEIVDVNEGRVLPDTVRMVNARAKHQATLMDDGSTIWLTGGFNDTGALRSTELVRYQDTVMTTSAEAQMNQPRFGHQTLLLSQSGGLILVVGGYTDTDGAALDTFEISGIGRGNAFDSRGTWRMQSPRAALNAIELRASRDIMIIGGLDSQGQAVGTAERLGFAGFGETNPFVSRDVGDMMVPRSQATSTLMPSGTILVVGGLGRTEGSVVGLDYPEYFWPYDPFGVQ